MMVLSFGTLESLKISGHLHHMILVPQQTLVCWFDCHTFICCHLRVLSYSFLQMTNQIQFFLLFVQWNLILVGATLCLLDLI